MVTLSVIYPKKAESHFNYDYYVRKHVPLVQARLASFGLVKAEIMRGVAAFDAGVPAFELIGTLTFSSLEEMQTGFATAGAEIIGDVANFTDIRPLIQVNQPIEI